MSGVQVDENSVKIQYPLDSYERYGYYPNNPRYYRYYGEIVARELCSTRRWGDEAYNFISSKVKCTKFVYKDSLISECDVLAQAVFYDVRIAGKLEVDGITYYVDRDNMIIDKVAPECHQNRRAELRLAGKKLVSSKKYYPLVKLAYLGYKTGPQEIGINYSDKAALKNQIRIEVQRLSATYYNRIPSRRHRGFTFEKVRKKGASYIQIAGRKSKLKLKDGMYPTLPGEYAQLFDQSILLARESDAGVDAVVFNGNNPMAMVSNSFGMRHVLTTELHVAFKAQWDLGKTFQSYARHFPHFNKEAAIMAKARGRTPQGVMEYDDGDEDFYAQYHRDNPQQVNLEDLEESLSFRAE